MYCSIPFNGKFSAPTKSSNPGHRLLDPELSLSLSVLDNKPIPLRHLDDILRSLLLRAIVFDTDGSSIFLRISLAVSVYSRLS